MFEHYGNKYECIFRVFSTDDRQDVYSSTNVDIYSTYPIMSLESRVKSSQPIGYHDRRYNHLQRWRNPAIQWDSETSRYIISCGLTRSRSKGEPMILSFKDTLQDTLGWGGRSRTTLSAPKKFNMAFVLPDAQNIAVMIEKGQTYYKLMNQRTRKKNLMFALARFLYRSCYEDDPQTLIAYLIKMINLPENVSYVLENRTPFFYFDVREREKIKVRLNTKMISNTECALEISDGIWAPISIKELDVFVNYFYHEQSRAKKWANMSPKKLWIALMGEEPSTSQLLLMEEFLIQNRTQHLVEERAKQLMNGLEVKYPDRIKLLKYKHFTIMLVKGKICDWIIINSIYKTKIQKVKTFAYISGSLLPEHYSSSRTHRSQNKFYEGQLRGPICIDNIHQNSSLGDQYAARALALLNDELTVKLVNTIANYLPESVLEGESESRFPFQLQDAEDIDAQSWEVIF